MRFIPTALAALTVLAASPTHATAQDVSAMPTYETVELEAGFLPDPHVTELTAGGSIEVDEPGCAYGMVASSPDVDLYYDAGSAPLFIYVIASEDTTLLINGPDGNWVCDDDGFGDLDPIVVLKKPGSGLYDIWVGTYGDDLVSATLYISEVDPRN